VSVRLGTIGVVGSTETAEPGVLERARGGDEQAFRELTEPYRRELQVHCYRILGSFTDAEDLLQETLLAAWRGLPDFQERSSVRTWLYRIATNRCLNHLRDAGRRIPTEPIPPFTPPEPTARDEIRWLQPYPDALLDGIPDSALGPDARYETVEAIELAFVAALQHMPPRQTATLVLRDVLGYTGQEVADMLGTSPTAIKGTLQRARATLAQHRGEVDSTAAPAGPDAETERATARRFAAAYQDADLDGVLALLTDDAWLSMPPAPHRYRGLDAIAAFYRATFDYRGPRRVRLLPTRANGQPAFGSYMTTPTGTLATPAGLFVLTLAADRIQAVTRFHDDALYPRFSLPDALRLG
jgi:RNA polymerase sigma-70 factor (ECF subfamily)